MNRIEEYIKFFGKYTEKECVGLEKERLKSILDETYSFLTESEKKIVSFLKLEKEHSGNIFSMNNEEDEKYKIELQELWENFTDEEVEVIENLFKNNKEELTYAEAYKKAEEIDKTIRADDPRLSGAVKIIHEEGSLLFLDGAFSEECGDWYFIFSEHHGFFVYNKDDVNIFNYKRIWK